VGGREEGCVWFPTQKILHVRWWAETPVGRERLRERERERERERVSE